MHKWALALAVVALTFGAACKSAEKDDSKAANSKGARTTGDTKTPVPTVANEPPAFADPNKVELFAQVSKGFKTKVEDFRETVEMKTAVIGWYDDKPFLVLAKDQDSCELFKPMRVNPPRFQDQVKLSISLEKLSEAQRKGAAPLAGTLEVRNGVILARGFNRMLMLYGGKGTKLRFDAGTMKVGDTVTGSFYLHEKDRGKYIGAMARGSFKATVCAKFVKPKPVKEPLPPALGKCPARTALTALDSAIDISKEGPFDLESFTIAKARWKDDGAKLQVYIANHDWPLEKLGGLISPIEKTGQAYVALSFYNQDKWVTIGEYKRGYRKPLTTSADINVFKRSIGLAIKEVDVKIIDMRNGKVCGSFDYKGHNTRVAGTFVAPLPEN